jgi:hypothetical protein
MRVAGRVWKEGKEQSGTQGTERIKKERERMHGVVGSEKDQ